MSIGHMASAAQIAGAIDLIRFDRVLESFKFKPSIGISARRLAQLGEELEDMREPLRRSVVEVMTLSILENFVSSGRPKWEPLSENTLLRHRKDGAGMILVRSNDLAEAASSPGIWSIGKTTAAVKGLPGNVWYGYIHQAGQAGNEYSGGNWFKKYQDAARKSLGGEASDKEVDSLAFKIFDKRQASHGPAPAGVPEIPARPFVMFQDQDIDDIQLIFAEWVEEKVREARI